MPNIRVKIDVTKLDKSAFFKGAKGTYCDLILWENDEPDQYGNTHSVKQDMGKDRRGEKTPYVGNAQPFGERKAPSNGYGRENQGGGSGPPPASDYRDEEDDIPF